VGKNVFFEKTVCNLKGKQLGKGDNLSHFLVSFGITIRLPGFANFSTTGGNPSTGKD